MWIPSPIKEGGCAGKYVENEGFNIQKNGGFNLEHPYSQDGNARKVFYFLLQIAYMILLLMEKGSLFRKSFPDGVGSLKNIAFRLLEAWRNLHVSPAGFLSLYKSRYYIRFDFPDTNGHASSLRVPGPLIWPPPGRASLCIWHALFSFYLILISSRFFPFVIL